MLKKLQHHWKVNGWGVFLIITTFAITGTFTAWVSKSITGWMQVDKFSFTWWTLKIAVFLIGYQIFILIFGFCLGQFAFFWNYEKKILSRFGLFKADKKNQIRLAIFASGAGTNAEKIIRYFTNKEKKTEQEVVVSLIVCNKPGAGVIKIAEDNSIDVLMIDHDLLNRPAELIEALKKNNIDYIILAGFLRKLPDALIKAWPNKIINIHPALLPKYGGKGMFGKHVHEAVLENKETESGITIHYVDELYDHGKIIFQAKCMIDDTDNPISLAEKIHRLEHTHFAPVIESVLKKQNQR